MLNDTELLEELKEDFALKESNISSREKSVVLYNDEVNTFEFVIEVLVEICHHQPLQAEQCAYITHYKGKCQVKTGAIKKLKSVCQALCDKGLSATIE